MNLVEEMQHLTGHGPGVDHLGLATIERVNSVVYDGIWNLMDAWWDKCVRLDAVGLLRSA
jgi:hypothetical protein